MVASSTDKKHFKLPKRFSAALSEKAYAHLRALNAKHGLGNNYLLTILLENLDSYADAGKLDAAFTAFKDEYGAPKGRMSI